MINDVDPSPFRIVAGEARDGADVTDEKIERLLVEIASDVGPMLPRNKCVAACRVCGAITEMTEEHLPPRGSFNKGTTRGFDLDELLGRDEPRGPDYSEGGPQQQGGIRAFTLCRSCNNLTGTRWGREYQVWARCFARLIAQVYDQHGDLDELVGFPAATGVQLQNVRPGRLVRQLLSMFLSISGGTELAEAHPEMRALVLGESPRALPAPLRLYMHGLAGGAIRIAGGNGAVVLDTNTGVTRRLLCFDFPPMGFVLQLAGSPLEVGIDITDFTEIDPDEVRSLQTDVPIGFAHKPFPGDYRTSALIHGQRDPT